MNGRWGTPFATHELRIVALFKINTTDIARKEISRDRHDVKL
jgi:hypothetical protein